jgi:hypothetical protein
MLSILCCIILFQSCKRPLFCGEGQGVENSAFTVAIYNTATNSYMFPRNEFQTTYKRDSVRVYTDGPRGFNWYGFGLEQDPKDPLNQYYGMGITPIFFIPEDNDAFNQEKTKKIYIQYNYNTADTLTLVFKAYRDKCDRGQFEYLKIYHRGNLISSSKENNTVVFTLNH